jgi:hypothetical protein
MREMSSRARGKLNNINSNNNNKIHINDIITHKIIKKPYKTDEDARQSYYWRYEKLNETIANTQQKSSLHHSSRLSMKANE